MNDKLTGFGTAADTLQTALRNIMPGGFDEPDRQDMADFMLATPQGKALSALVEAALAWHEVEWYDDDPDHVTLLHRSVVRYLDTVR